MKMRLLASTLNFWILKCLAHLLNMLFDCSRSMTGFVLVVFAYLLCIWDFDDNGISETHVNSVRL